MDLLSDIHPLLRLCDLYRAKVQDFALSCWVLTGQWPVGDMRVEL